MLPVVQAEASDARKRIKARDNHRNLPHMSSESDSRRRPVFITRRVSFCAAHRYHKPSWSAEKNGDVFGPSNNPFGHGHNYELEVTLQGEVDPDTGMVMHLSEVDAILREHVIDRLDHRHLSEELPEWKEQIPTTENIVVDIWNRIAGHLERPRARLYRVCLYESPALFAEYYGGDDPRGPSS